MKRAVVYYSRSGNTKAVAEAIAQASAAKAVSADDPAAKITEPVDFLFVGGALYFHGIDKNLKAFLEALPEGAAKKAAVFSTSWISKHAIDVIKDALKAKNIPVIEDALYIKKTPDAAGIRKAETFAAKYI